MRKQTNTEINKQSNYARNAEKNEKKKQLNQPTIKLTHQNQQTIKHPMA